MRLREKKLFRPWVLQGDPQPQTGLGVLVPGPVSTPQHPQRYPHSIRVSPSKAKPTCLSAELPGN